MQINKVIAVFDKPDSCDDCPFNYDWRCCELDYKMNGYMRSDRVPEFCPLIDKEVYDDECKREK